MTLQTQKWHLSLEQKLSCLNTEEIFENNLMCLQNWAENDADEETVYQQVESRILGEASNQNHDLEVTRETLPF